jgi:membrane protease YdiL (CAAX protease family)
MDILKRIFLSPDEPRLRAGWRLGAQIAIFIAFSLVLTIPALFVLALVPNSFYAVNVGLIGLPVVLSVWLSRRYLDKRSIRSLGLVLNRQAAVDAAVGIGISGVQMLAIYLIELQVGWLSFEGFGFAQIGWLGLIGGLIGWGLMFLAVGFYEELLSRGYQLQNLEEGGNLFWAVALSSSFFGMLHLFNPGATWASTLGVGLAGVFFAYGYLRTRQLWLPIGMHIGWNFFEGPVFGFPVSGMETVSFLRTTVDGPDLWTGGVFGPEAGLVVIPGLLVGAGLVYVYTRGRKETIIEAGE